MIQIIKIGLIAILLLCLPHMPYGYYQFARLISFAGFIYLCYEEIKKERKITGLLCAALAILFNPVIKIHFERELWNIIDIIIAALLAVWIIIDFVTLLHGKRKER